MDGSIPLNNLCGTCKHPRGAHFKTYDEKTVGCAVALLGGTMLFCPCEGYMATESLELRKRFIADVDWRVAFERAARMYLKVGGPR